MLQGDMRDQHKIVLSLYLAKLTFSLLLNESLCRYRRGDKGNYKLLVTTKKTCLAEIKASVLKEKLNITNYEI